LLYLLPPGKAKASYPMEALLGYGRSRTLPVLSPAQGTVDILQTVLARTRGELRVAGVLRPPAPTGSFLRGVPIGIPPTRFVCKAPDLPQDVLKMSSGETCIMREESVTLTPQTMRLWEDASRRALIGNSILESSLSALTRQLGQVETEGPHEGEFAFHEDIQPEHVQALLSLALKALKAATENTASVYLNCVLARRDAALERVDLPTQVKSELRAVPLPAESLFGQPLLDAVHKNAELRRDVVLSRSMSQFAVPAPPGTASAAKPKWGKGPKFAKKKGMARGAPHTLRADPQPSRQQNQPSKGGASQRGHRGRGGRGRGGGSSRWSNPPQ